MLLFLSLTLSYTKIPIKIAKPQMLNILPTLNQGASKVISILWIPLAILNLIKRVK